MSESKELVLVSLPSVPADLEAAFIDDKYINNLIAEIREKTSTVVGDLNTVKGRGVYTSAAMNVRRTKTAIDEAGKNLVAEMKKRPALVDASRRKVREALDELAIEIRKPVTEWEAEQKEKEFNAMFDEALELDTKITAERAAALAIKIEADHEMALLMNKDIDREREEARQKVEQEKREHEERIKREAEEKARREADEAAKREIEAAAAREREALLAKELAERERIESEQRAEREKKEAAAKAEREKEEAIQLERAAAEAREQARLAEEKRIADEAAQRTADKEHRREVNLAAVKGLVDSGISEQCARECIKAIAQGKVPNTAINY